MALPRPRQSILLVEDDPNDVFLFERALRAANITRPLNIVHDGETALSYVEGQSIFTDRKLYPVPSVVFLDLKLPGLSGFEVLTWLRQQPRSKRIQVVVLTGSPLTIDIYRAFELGANAYLVKPINTETLVALGNNLDVARLAQANPNPGIPTSAVGWGPEHSR